MVHGNEQPLWVLFIIFTTHRTPVVGVSLLMIRTKGADLLYSLNISIFQVDLTIALSPLGEGLHCDTHQPLLEHQSFNQTW